MSVRKKYSSIKIVQILLKIIGFWHTESKKEEIILKCCRIYTAQAIGGILITQFMEYLISTENITDFTLWLCSGLPTILVTIKFSVFFLKRREVIDLIRYTKKHIWYQNYSKSESEIMDACDKQAFLKVSSYLLLVYGVVFCYFITPVIENVGKAENERKFPFNGIALFFGSESTKSPKFEIMFTIEVMPLFHVGILFCGFDNLLFLLCTFLTGQFKLLQHRLKNICTSLDVESAKNRQEISENLKELVEFHKSLTTYIFHLEDIFNIILFCQLLISSIMICVAGFQVFLVKASTIKGMIFKFHLAGGFLQILLVTWSANDIMTESNAVAFSAYDMLWYYIPYDKHGKSIRQGVKTIIMRSSRSSYLTAAGFFPVSLASFMSVMSTTLSYFTLLRQFL